MKKALIFIICFLSFSLNTEAFLWQDLWLNLYESIDEWFQELEQKQYEYELSGQGKSIKEKINQILKNEWIWECIEWEISSDDVEKISQWYISFLIKNMKVWENCKSQEWEINNNTLINLITAISNLKSESENKAKEKTKKIHTISRIWIYSDGNIDNSPFDLIKDLQDIDQIIFSSKINYEWEELLSDDELINCITWKEKCFDNGTSISDIGIEEPKILKDLKEKIKNDWNNGDSEENEQTEEELENNYLCVDDINNNSWLDSEALNNIINEISNWNSSNQNSSSEKIPETPRANSQHSEEEKDDFSIGSYGKINDPWPCYDFFCITIEFITYQHKLLIWWESISIEYLLNRSNKHLRKFASTSLIPAKMSTNNFELWLKDLSLPDIFHLWFVITKKPVPILDVQPTKGEKESGKKFTKKNLLEEYYKNLWLEYSRRNDLDIFKEKDIHSKTLLNSWEGEAAKVREKLYNEYKEMQQAWKNNVISDQISQQSITEEFKDFEEQFTELQSFSNSMNDYVNTIHFLIKEMVKIPQG